MDIFSFNLWANGFAQVFASQNISYLFLGTLVGMVIGVLPGVGPNFAVAMLLPFTFGMRAEAALILICSCHAATAYGDSIASIMINVPGGGGSVPACWDGFPMARQGRGGVALALSAMASWFGGLVGWLSLVLLSPILVFFAMKIGPPEMFMVTLLALSMLAVSVRGDQTIRGIIMVCCGLLFAFVGMDPMTGTYRYTFGIPILEDGIDIIPMVVGLFAISEVFRMVEAGGYKIPTFKVGGGSFEAMKIIAKNLKTLIRCGLIGAWVGVLPAVGMSAAGISCYLMEKQSAKDPDSFGKGNPTGVIAPEVAKGACIVGDLVPTFTLGVPGSSSTAILMAALILHGARPGKEFFSGAFPYIIFVGILIAQFSYLIVGLTTAKYWAKIILIPTYILAPTIGVLAVIGAYADAGRIEVMFILMLFGFLGYVMNKYDYPAAAMLLGLVLGKLLEANFHRANLLFGGSLTWFYKRPVALGLFLVVLLSVGWPYFKRYRQWMRNKQ